MMNRRERTLFRATMAVVAFAVVYFLLIDPALTRWEDLAKRSANLETTEAQLRMSIRERINLKDGINEMEERITSSALETMEADFHTHLKEIAEKSKVTPSSVSMVKRRPLRDDFEEIVLSVNMECKMAELTDYLYHLEKTSDRLVKITRLDVSRGARRRSGAGDLTVNMVLSTVVKSEPAEIVQEGEKDEGE